jgi:hypothetical protein
VRAVKSPERRAWYASHIRVLHVSSRGALWRALAAAPATASLKRIADNGPNVEASSGGTAHHIVLPLPRLAVLCITGWWQNEHAGMGRLRFPAMHASRSQAPVVKYITADLTTLICYIDDDVIGRLEAMQQQGQPMRFLRKLCLTGLHHGGAAAASWRRG